MLIKFNLIKNDELENRQIYFDTRIPAKKAKQFHFASRERSVKILDYLKKVKKGCPKYRISKNLSMHPNTVTKYLTKLEDIGLIIRTETPNRTLFHYNPSIDV